MGNRGRFARGRDRANPRGKILDRTRLVEQSSGLSNTVSLRDSIARSIVIRWRNGENGGKKEMEEAEEAAKNDRKRRKGRRGGEWEEEA